MTYMKLSSHIFCISLAAALCAAANEPIHWASGDWDESGAPKGALLTDNPGWWGRSVFTGVTYSYDEGGTPTSPADKSGRCLIDAKMLGDWKTTVGKGGNRRIAAVFDFKRPCVFSEVDLFTRVPGLHGKVEVGDDGTNWTAVCSFEVASKRGRIGVDGAKGRFMRLSAKADKGTTYLDEVLVWGEGEVSEKYPEAIVGIPSGDALTFTRCHDGDIEIVPLAKPTLAAAKEAASGAGRTALGQILLARNETETRYFAVVNASASNRTVRLSTPDFGEGVKAEMRIGGLVRVSRPKVKLTEGQLHDLMVTDTASAEGGEPEKLDILPFFTPEAKPTPNFARRHLANPAQVIGFPDAVPLAPGEGCVVMLRVTTDNASPCARRGVLRANAAEMEIVCDVRNVALPDLPIWVFAWSQFTSQFPFESQTRYENDVARVAELGISSCRGLPEPRTKQALLKARVPHTIHWAGHVGGKAFTIAYKNKAGLKEFDEQQKAKMAADAHGIVERASALGLKPGEYLTDLPDEPGLWNAELLGKMARTIKEAEPTLQIYMNPCFWLGNGFPPATNILAVLEPYYNDVIDISCPIRNLVRPGNLLTTNLWTKPRAVNAQYIHPAARAGRSIAWSSFDNGMNGFGYFCYYWPRGDAWDIRTWSWLDYRYQMVFSLENDVAITPIYETMREAWEDYRLLTALRAAGKDALLAELLKSYEKATDYTDWENVPNRSNFQSLRDKALGAFGAADCSSATDRHAASVVAVGGVPRFAVDGKPMTATAVMPSPAGKPGEAQRQLKEFREAGVMLSSDVWTMHHKRYNPRQWWLGEGEYDFELFDAIAKGLVDAAPDGFIFPRIKIDPPAKWCEAHSEEMMDAISPRPESKAWRALYRRMLRDVVAHVEASSYARNVIGYHLGAFHCGEWLTGEWKSQESRAYIPSVPCEEENPLPPVEVTAARRAAIDGRANAVADMLIDAASCVKELTNGKKLVGAFFGYPSIAHEKVSRVIRSGKVDFFAAPPLYSAVREPGHSGRSQAYYQASCRLHNRVYYEESDFRTFLSDPAFSPPNQTRRRPLDESIGIVRRSIGKCLAGGWENWWFLLGGNDTFSAPELMESIRIGAREERETLFTAQWTPAEVAVFTSADEYSTSKEGTHAPEFRLACKDSLHQDVLPACGVPFDSYELSDISDQRLPEYKVYVFPNAFTLGEAMLAKIKERVCRMGKTAVWVYRAPGGFDEDAVANGWRNVVMPLSSTAAAFRNVFREAGAHVWLETNDVLAAGRGYVMVHAASDGEKRINLPTTCNAHEIFGSSPDRVGVSSLVERMEKGETRVWKIGSVSSLTTNGR